MEVFIDTMVYLHYRNLEEIDLPSLLGVEHASVVIPRITLRELDKHKNAHSLSRVRDRARRNLVRIENWTSNEAYLRPNVRAELFLSAPIVDFAAHGLDPAWNDDVLIASVIHYKASHPEVQVVLVTQDSGPKLTAKELGISVYQLPEQYLLPVEPDPLEVENRELRRSLEQIQNAMPELVVGFAVDDGPEQTSARFVMPAPPKTAEEVEQDIRIKIDEIRTKFPKRESLASAQKKEPFAFLASEMRIGLSVDPISPDEYERYNREVDDFVTGYERFMRRTMGSQALAMRTITFEIWIRNVPMAIGISAGESEPVFGRRKMKSFCSERSPYIRGTAGRR